MENFICSVYRLFSQRRRYKNFDNVHLLKWDLILYNFFCKTTQPIKIIPYFKNVGISKVSLIQPSFRLIAALNVRPTVPVNCCRSCRSLYNYLILICFPLQSTRFAWKPAIDKVTLILLFILWSLSWRQTTIFLNCLFAVCPP